MWRPYSVYYRFFVSDSGCSCRNFEYSFIQKNEFETSSALLEKLKPQDNMAARINNILLQATIYSDLGATIEEILLPLNIKSRKTIQTRLNAIPQNVLVIDKSIRPYRYKLKISELICL